MKEPVQLVHGDVPPPVDLPPFRLPPPAIVTQQRVGPGEVDEAVLADEEAVAGAVESRVGGVVPRVHHVPPHHHLVHVLDLRPLLVLHLRFPVCIKFG